MVRCTRCGKEGHNARNKLCPALKDSQRPGSGAGAGSNDRFAPQTNLNAENRSSLRAPAGNQRYALAGGSGYKKDAFRNNDLGDSRVHDELSYHFNIAYIKDVDVPRHWLKMLHQFFMRMNASMIHGVMERVHDETIADRQLQASISTPPSVHVTIATTLTAQQHSAFEPPAGGLRHLATGFVLVRLYVIYRRRSGDSRTRLSSACLQRLL